MTPALSQEACAQAHFAPQTAYATITEAMTGSRSMSAVLL